MKKVIKKIIKINLVLLIILVVNFAGLVSVHALSGNEIVVLANASRNSEGIAKLSINSKLATAAYNKANDMLEHDYFAHTSPDGKTPWDFIKAADYNYVYAGENLSIGYTDAQELHDAWMNSASHRENIMNGNFEEIGIAVVSGEYEGAQTTVVVQMFGTSEKQTANIATELENNISQTEQKIEGEQIEDQEVQADTVEVLNIIKDKTAVQPEQLFMGEEITFTVTYTGQIRKMIAKLGDQEIDLSENTKISTNDNGEHIIEKQIKAEIVGEFQVSLEATDLNNKKQSLDLGTVKVAEKEVVNDNSANTTSYQFKEGNQGKIFLYVLASILIIMISAGSVFVYRYAKSQRHAGA